MKLCLSLVALGALTLPCLAVDQNGNGLSDVWELKFGAGGLTAGGDADADGASNEMESLAGTNPFDRASRPVLTLAPWSPTEVQINYPRVAGKRYRIESKLDLNLPAWTTDFTEIADTAGIAAWLLPAPGGAKFWRLEIDDVDSDADGVKDAEELWIGFNPATNRTDRNDTLDGPRVTAGLTAASVVTIGALDAGMSEHWPDPGMVVVRRSGGLAPLTVNVSFSGTATRELDYSASVAANTVIIPPGVREVAITLAPLVDLDGVESAETIIVSVLNGAGYSRGTTTSATVTLEKETATSLPSAKAAARFLIQAAFGPDQDSADTDDLPDNVDEVMAMGFAGWIDDQFTRPIGYIQPWVDWAAVHASGLQLYGNWKEFAWWSRAMGAPRLRPDDTNDPITDPVLPDPLRQRVAFALSQILVVGDRPEQLAVEQRGMANYYDLFEKHAFGNYRDLLLDVALHPAMGIYLSHLGNQKADPVNRIYPDENFAREIMQLFTIGLWKLNADGTRQLDPQGQPKPTYDNGDITELARVFTGLSFGNNAAFVRDPRDFTVPMKGWDAFHDCNPKILLGGLETPLRPESEGNTGTATMEDVTAAVKNLFDHDNVGPFLALRLIQRLVASNPSPAYVGRVAAAFADNGAGVRGDMKAVVKAILLDPEARDPAMMTQPAWGKLREPFLRCVNVAHAFKASSTSGHFALDQFALDHLQDPMNSPSVFNFFLPTHSPPGPITQQGFVAPEFQIVNASSAVTGANYFWNAILGDLHRWGHGTASYVVRLNLPDELAFIVPAAQINANVPAGPALDPDPLLCRLDLVLTGGTLSPRQFQIIREAMLRVGTGTWMWHRERLRLAIYLITTSADFNVLR